MNKNDKKCPNCGESGHIDSKFVCHNCNSQLKFDPDRGYYSSDFIVCPECKQLNAMGDNFCSKCGATITTGVAAIVPPSGESKKGIFTGIHSRFIAVGVALLLGVGLTWTYFSFGHRATGSNGPRIDVVFCIDTTGSMGDEIDDVKAQLRNMIYEIQKGNPSPVVRFGVVAFKDRGDDYVVKSYDLTGDAQKIEGVINSLSASGGGDHEESVNEALHMAVQQMSWDMSGGVSKMVFLIGDAGPHMDYANDYDYREEMKIANSRGIMITTISCSGMDSTGNSVFQELASTTNGAFDFLTYRQAYVNQRGEEKVILYQGGKGYVVDDKYKDDTSWTLGARDLESEKKAEVFSDSALPGSPSCEEALGGEGGSYKAQELENNLTEFCTQQVQNEAVKQGVTY